MTLYQRYVSGHTKQVYDEIYSLGQNAFHPSNLPEIEKVLTETFERVAYNLDVIYKELTSISYSFKTNPKYNFEKPLHRPLPDTEALLKKMDIVAAPFGFCPLSLKWFFKIVGGVNFAWDYDADSDSIWELADPIQVASLDSVVDAMTSEYWKEEIQEYVDDSDFGCAFIELAADELHKDNISGGQAYSIEISKEPSIDSKFMNEPNGTTFIDYLRICFENCGFPGIARNDMKNSYQEFFNKTTPQLKPI